MQQCAFVHIDRFGCSHPLTGRMTIRALPLAASDLKLEVDYLVPTTVSAESLVLEVEYIGNVVTSRVEFSLGRAEAIAVTKRDDGNLASFKLFSPFVQILDPPNHSLSGDGILQVRLQIIRNRTRLSLPSLHCR